MNRKIHQLCVSGAVVLLGLASFGCKKSDKPTVAPPVKVSVIVVGNENDRLSTSFSGTVSAANSTTISFAVPGTIADLYAKEGQNVTSGQLLGRLKSGDYVNADNIAKAELAEAQDAYDRLKKLHDAKALPDMKWVEMEQKLKQAQNAADMSARALGETELRAPMSGVISRKMADKGQNVTPVEPIYEIISANALTVDISVSENEIERFNIGDSASVKFENGKSLAGRLSQKSVVADPLTRSYNVKIEIPSVDGHIMPGMLATVEFSQTKSGDATDGAFSVNIPSQAVNLSNDNHTFIWVVSNGEAQRRLVEADEMVAEGVLINSGLNPGDSVIVEGMEKIGAGTRVEPVIFNKN